MNKIDYYVIVLNGLNALKKEIDEAINETMLEYNKLIKISDKTAEKKDSSIKSKKEVEDK